MSDQRQILFLCHLKIRFFSWHIQTGIMQKIRWMAFKRDKKAKSQSLQNCTCLFTWVGNKYSKCIIETFAAKPHLKLTTYLVLIISILLFTRVLSWSVITVNCPNLFFLMRLYESQNLNIFSLYKKSVRSGISADKSLYSIVWAAMKGFFFYSTLVESHKSKRAQRFFFTFALIWWSYWVSSRTTIHVSVSPWGFLTNLFFALFHNPCSHALSLCYNISLADEHKTLKGWQKAKIRLKCKAVILNFVLLYVPFLRNNHADVDYIFLNVSMLLKTLSVRGKPSDEAKPKLCPP